jgi:hypothetical protein
MTRTTNKAAVETAASGVLASSKISTYSEYALLDDRFEQLLPSMDVIARLPCCIWNDQVCIRMDTKMIPESTRVS